MTSKEICLHLVCPLRTPSSSPGTHEFNLKRYVFIEGARKCMTITERKGSSQIQYRNPQGINGEVYIDGSKINERVGTATVINHHFQNGETTGWQLSKRLLWITAETIAITLTLNYYRHIDTEKGNVVVYCDSMSSLQFNLPYHIPPLGYRLTKALVPTSAWCQAIVALRIMR